ncbi:LPS-assembly protein LptD [Endozoicomonas euniceicola]|uniref:LPS-assembly protein LptD n=1 Tax=Endozoicomonas euniceicola TaxID=1234143 RepID=A0ABY6GS79_9GAMM|nr:LPS-assembly protein LptD [Endozoicomonas euniceicola]UYM14938.1 LPS-assembly protein LptD [Endozoicomonas euniceicola]
METHHLPFKLRALTLAIASAIIAGQPVSKARAENNLSADTEWSCEIASDDSGWQCSVVPLKQGAMKRAPRPVTAPVVSPTSKTMAVVSQPEGIRTQLDWVNKSNLSEARCQRLKREEPWCAGTYVEPTRPGKNFKGDPNSAPIIADADESTYQNSIATLLGAVKIRQGNRQLESDEAYLDNEKNFGEFKGNVVFREPGSLIVGDTAQSQLDTGRTEIDNARYVMHESHARGSAEVILRHEDATMELDDATYTSCPPGEKGWQLSGDSVTLDPSTGYGTARNAVVRVQDLPVFYSPYLYFPIDQRRQSGFLYPTKMGFNDEAGVEFGLPYYWNIAPNYDATFTPRVMTKRGFLLENEFRYLTEKDEGELGVAGLIGGDQLEDENRHYKKDRWFANARHRRQFNDRWMAELDYADASDKDYLEDFGSSLNYSASNPLNQRVMTRYDGGDDYTNWQAKLDVHKKKNMNRTADDPYNKLPQIELRGNWQATDRVQVNYLADYTYFDRADDWNYVKEQPHSDFPGRSGIYESIYDKGYGIQRAVGSRAYFESGVSYPMHKSWGFLTPAVTVRSVNYSISNLNQEQVIADLNSSYWHRSFEQGDFTKSPSTTVPAFSVDSGLYLDRSTNLFGAAYTHTLEPRIKYLYAPYVKGQEFNPLFDTGNMGFSYSALWSDNRFSGYDRLADANQLSLGFTTRFIQDDGFERMRFGIGQIVYFDDRQVYIGNNLGSGDPNYIPDFDKDENARRQKDELTAGTSPVASEFIYNFTRTMSLRQDFVWNGNENRVDNYALTYRYRPSWRKTFNVGFRFADRVDRYKKNEDNTNYVDPVTGKNVLVNNDLKATDISFAWPIPYTRNWSAMGRWQYDMTNKRNLEELFGVEYASCCYQVRLFWRSYVKSTDNIDHPKNRDGIYLQFVLRGLGSLTGSSGKEYLQGISGYTIREK